MTIDVIVRRCGGELIAEDIVSPYSTTTEAAIARGTTELDEWEAQDSPERIEIKYRDGLRLGQTVEVQETTTGEPYRGKISAISHRFGGAELLTILEVKKRYDEAC